MAIGGAPAGRIAGDDEELLGFDATSRVPLAISAEACAALPEWLSSSEFKRRLYGTDTYAIEGLEAVRAVAGLEARSFCYSHSLLVVKPEAVVTRRLERIFSWLEEVGFPIVEAVPFRFSPAITRGLWAYHWNAVTGAHRRAVDLLVESGPSVAILVRSMESGELPASLRLAELKGHADPARREPGQLRYELGNHNALLNHVHSPDEPIDLLRELAVVLPSRELERVLGVSQRCQRVDARHLGRNLAPSLYRDAGDPQSLDLGEALAEVEGALGESIDFPGSGDVDDLLRRCQEEDLILSRWQLIVLTTACMESVRKDVRRLVPSVSVADWLASGN
jgi:nucleoside diphosphate kinase